MSILGQDADVVEEYRYRGIHINNRLNWKTNTEVVSKKRMSKLYFLTKRAKREQNHGDFPSASCSEHNVLCCGVLGKQHQSW